MDPGERARNRFLELHDRIRRRFEAIDGRARFRGDRREDRPGRSEYEDGRGRPRVLEGGVVSENPIIDLSVVGRR